MRVFYAQLQAQADRADVVSAIVAAHDYREALSLLAADPRLAGYEQPPLHLSDAKDLTAAAEKLRDLLDDRSLQALSKGVHAISPV